MTNTNESESLRAYDAPQLMRIGAAASNGKPNANSTEFTAASPYTPATVGTS